MSRGLALALAVSSALIPAAPAAARDKIRIAAPHPTILPTTIPTIAQRFGLFDKANLDVEVLWTAGGADAQQATVNGSVDVAVQTGTAGILSAIQRGAPVAIVAADATGAADVVWLVKAEKPWKSFADLQGNETVSFSRPGSSSDFTVRTLAEHFKAKVRFVPSGSQPETLVMLMTGQIDAGFANPPLPREVAEGKLRILARGGDAPKLRSQTIRVHAVNTGYLERNRDALKRFLAAWKGAIDLLFTDPKAVEVAAAQVKISPAEAQAIIRDFLPREAFVMNKIGDLEMSIEQAIANKQLRGPLTDAQKAGIHSLVAELNAP